MDTTKAFFRKCLLLGILSCGPHLDAVQAVQVQTPQSARVRCAVLEEFSGDVQILSADRSELLPTRPKSSISCDDWVSVGQGFAILRHTQGYLFHVAQGSFVQIQDPDGAANSFKDHLLLFRGQISVRSGKDLGEIRVATANGRARIASGTAAVIFDSEKVETQLIALDQPVTLENRFLIKRKMTVKAGEATVLKLSADRMIPSPPQAVAVAALKGMLESHHFGQSFQKIAVKSAQTRHDRKLASSLKGHKAATSEEPAPNEVSKPVARKPAAAVSRKMHPTPLNRHFLDKVTGGGGAEEEVLFPHGHSGRSPQGAKIQIITSDEATGAGKPDTDRPEKSRLIQELGEIKPE